MSRILASGNGIHARFTVPYAFVALLIGLTVPFEPMLVFAAAVVFTTFLFSIMYPEQTGYALLIGAVVSIQYIFPVRMMGMDLQSLYKLGILMLTLPAIIHYGFYRKQVLPIVAIFALLIITFMFSDRHPLLAASGSIKAFIGLAAPFVLLLIRWRHSAAENHIKLLCFMPLISIAVGTLFHITGLHPLFEIEFTGAIRLQGANIAAHLGFLAFIAFLVSMIEIKRNAQKMTFYYIMMSTNFLILLLTGTRGPLIASLVMIALFIFDLTKQFLRGRIGLIIPLCGFIVVLIMSVYLQLDNFMKRSFERSTGTGIDLSGRIEAWSFFMNGVKDSPWFGRGLGSVLVGNDGSLYEGFVVPHNEYIRFYYDGGIIGAILLFAALFIVFKQIYMRLKPAMKSYFAAFIAGFLIYSISDNTLSTVQFIVPFCIYLNALYTLSSQSTEKEVTV